MNSPLKIGILGVDFHKGNLGVGALAAGTLRCILHRFPGAEVFLLNYSRRRACRTVRLEGNEVKIPLVNMRFSKKLYLSNNIAILFLLVLVAKVLPYKKLTRKLVDGNECLRKIEQADLFVSIAGGDSFSDIYGLGRLLYVALPQILVLLVGKRLILMPQTLGPFRTRLAKAIARYILRRAQLVYSRDYQGIAATNTLLGWQGDSGKVRFCHDVGFVVDPVGPPEIEMEGFLAMPEGVVGLNVSGLLFTESGNRDNVFGLRTDYRELVYALLDFLLRRKKMKVLLVPHVFTVDWDTESDSVVTVNEPTVHEPTESDSSVCQKIFEELRSKYPGQLGLVRGLYNQNEIKHIIGQCDFFIGSRMHACIAALSQNVPAVAVAYSDKFVGVMGTIGIESLVADPRTMRMEEIVRIVDRAYDQRLLIRSQLERKIPQVKAAVLNLFSELEAVGAIAPARATSFGGDVVFQAERR